MIYNISSKDNKNLKLVRSLMRKSARTKEGLFVAEGRKIVSEAMDYAKDLVEFAVMSQAFCEKEKETAEKVQGCCDVYIVPDHVFAGLCDTETPQGVLVVLKMKEQSAVLSGGEKNVLILDGISEPGNMGTIIRTAEALAFDKIYITKGSADIYSPKTVRSTMGSLFRMDICCECGADTVKAIQKEGFFIAATSPQGREILEGFATPEKIGVVIGNEAHGVCDEIMELSDTTLKITMDGMAESLNAGIAAGIVMHWIKNH